jgi:anion-transporting  ArsA/GET3 family ATPase
MTARAQKCNRYYAVSMSPGPRLHVVTGKGGTGKTTLAAALALSFAQAGAKTLLLEVEGRAGLAPLFGRGDLPYQEVEIAKNLWGMSVDPREALLEYIEMYYKAGAAGRALAKFGVIDFATTIAPGLRDVLLTGKAYEATRRRPGNKSGSTFEGPWVYDAVVMDAPPTGRIGKFLDINAQLASLAKVGPIRKQAESISELMHSGMTTVHMVTLPEEMPIQESLEAITELRSLGIQVGHIFVNQMYEEKEFSTFSDPIDSAVATALRAEVDRYQKRVTRQQEQLKLLKDFDVIEIAHMGEEISFEILEFIATGLREA